MKEEGFWKSVAVIMKETMDVVIQWHYGCWYTMMSKFCLCQKGSDRKDQSAYIGSDLKFYNYGKGTPVRKYKSSSRTSMLSLLGRRKIESLSISSSMCLDRHQSSRSVTSPMVRALFLQVWKWDLYECLAFKKKFF